MTDFFLLLEGDFSGYLLQEDGVSRIIIASEDDFTGGDGEYYHNLRIAEANKRLKLAEKQKQIKEDEVIRLKVESQELLLKKRELGKPTDKQSKRQLAALEKEYSALQIEIAAQMFVLDKLQIEAVKRKNNVLLLLLSAACPFSTITIH